MLWNVACEFDDIITGRNGVVAKVIFLHLSVIHSVHRGEGVCLSACWDTTTPHPEQTPPDQIPTPLGAANPGSRPPLDQTPHPPRSRPPWPDTHPPTLPGADTPPGADSPQEQTPPPPGSRLQHAVYERPVRILLECILVMVSHCMPHVRCENLCLSLWRRKKSKYMVIWGRDTVYYNDVNILAERTKIFEMKIV